MVIEIFIGVLSGTLTAALLYVTHALWVKVVFPWYQAIRYQGADISGRWGAKQTFEDKSENNFSLVLKQNAHVITGSLQLTYQSPEKNFNFDYTVNGEYWEGYLNLSCRSKDRRVYSQASMLVKITSGGTGMFGQFSFRNAMNDYVDTVSIELYRDIVKG
ncbi:MAG: hypothetical protein ABL860_02200 [Candidatus Nitrotoga sp.]